MRVRPRPTSTRSAGVAFATFERGAEAVRELSQSGLHPSNCRLIDPLEARLHGRPATASRAMLVLGFESADHARRTPWMERALEIVREHGGAAEERAGGDAVGSWRSGVPARAVPARLVRRLRRAVRHVRDRDHVGALRRRSTRRSWRGRARGGGRAGARLVPVHPRLSRRAGAVLHGHRPGAARRRGRAVGGDQGRRVRRGHRRRRARSPTTTPSAATTAPGTTASAPTPSPPRCAARRTRSTRAGSSTPACCSTPERRVPASRCRGAPTGARTRRRAIVTGRTRPPPPERPGERRRAASRRTVVPRSAATVNALVAWPRRAPGRRATDGDRAGDRELVAVATRIRDAGRRPSARGPSAHERLARAKVGSARRHRRRRGRGSAAAVPAAGRRLQRRPGRAAGPGTRTRPCRGARCRPGRRRRRAAPRRSPRPVPPPPGPRRRRPASRLQAKSRRDGVGTPGRRRCSRARASRPRCRCPPSRSHVKSE